MATTPVIAERFFSITPDDDSNLRYMTQYIYVGGTGNVAVEESNSGNSTVFNSVPAGTFMPVQADKVLSTGTTATNLVGLA